MRTLLAVLILLAAAVPASAASSRLEPITRTAFNPATDGDRLLTWTRTQAGRGRVHVYDIVTGERWSVPKDRRCTAPYWPTPADRALVSCRRGDGEVFDTFDPRTGALAPLPRTADVGGRPERLYWQLLGRHWAYGSTGEAPVTSFVFAWRTGELRALPAGTARLPDLDDPALGPALRCPASERFGSYAHPYFMSHSPRAPLILRHCDGGRRMLYPGASHGSGLVDGFASWMVRDRVYAYDIRRRKQKMWIAPRFPDLSEDPLRVLLTRRAAILAVTRSEECETGVCFQAASRLHLARF